MKEKRWISKMVMLAILFLCGFMLADVSKIHAEEESDSQIVRVLIKTSNFSGMFHGSVTVTSTKGFTISNGSKTKNYGAKKKVTITSKYGMLKNGASITVKANEDGKIKISSIKRSQGIPAYRGKLVIKNVPGSGLTVVNHVSLEEYLYSVVSSEMSPSFHVEALKAQAVAARSYACAHLNSEAYKAYQADFDDSTSYQVYNNCREAASVKTAVDATKNKVISAKGVIISTYFFSTSFGQTALPSQIWNGGGDDKYYNSVVQNKDEKAKDLSSEEEFRNFYNDKTTEAFEKDVDWYRWKVSTSYTNLQKQINSKLGSCYVMYPSYIKVEQKDGSYKSKPINSIGKLKSVDVMSRENSGAIKEIRIVGSAATVLVSYSSSIRILFAPIYDSLQKQTGAKVYGLSMLPNTFFYIDQDGTNCTIYGGGNGHGVGMSQNGANQMAKSGYSFEKILKHYFRNIDIIENINSSNTPVG